MDEEIKGSLCGRDIGTKMWRIIGYGSIEGQVETSIQFATQKDIINIAINLNHGKSYIIHSETIQNDIHKNPKLFSIKY